MASSMAWLRGTRERYVPFLTSSALSIVSSRRCHDIRRRPAIGRFRFGDAIPLSLFLSGLF